MPLTAAKIVREIFYAPPSMPVVDLLAKMQATRIHLALVIDEYGGSDGLVSMEDLVELIVGDIADEHDERATPAVIRQNDGSFVANGRASLDDVRAMIGEEFDVGEAASEVDTLGGYLVVRAGHVPVRGELVPGPATVRGRSPRCRPATGEAGQNLSRQKSPPGSAARCSRAGESAGARPALRDERPNKPELSAGPVNFERPIHTIVLAWGWRRWLIAFFAGAFSALAMAPFNAWPVLLLTFPTLVWLIDGTGTAGFHGATKAASPDGGSASAIFSPGYTGSVSLSWSTRRLSAGCCRSRSSGYRPVLRSSPASALPSRVSVDPRCSPYSRFGRGAHGGRMVARPSAHRLPLEYLWLRAHLAARDGAKRLRHRHLGAHFHRRRCFREPGYVRRRSRRNARPWLPLASGSSLLAGLASFGALRLSRTPTQFVDGVRLRIMQPNLQQDVRFNYAAKQQVMDRYVALSDRASGPQSPASAARRI